MQTEGLPKILWSQLLIKTLLHSYVVYQISKQKDILVCKKYTKIPFNNIK